MQRLHKVRTGSDRDCVKSQTDATALRRGDSRSRLQRKQRLRMPQPCAVETHACGYKERSAAFADATALRRGDSRLLLKLRR